MSPPIQTDRPRPPPPPEPDGWPPRRRSFALTGVVVAMLAVAGASGAYMVWHSPLAPDPDGGLRCSRAFDARLHAARGGSDADLLALSDEALAIGCGTQAHEAADLVGGDASEPAAWTLARFADPGETAPVFRQGRPPVPARAAALYARWAPTSPRMAEALRRLCASGDPALDDPASRRACAR